MGMTVVPFLVNRPTAYNMAWLTKLFFLICTFISTTLGAPLQRSTDCPRFCPATWEPVCGSDLRDPTTSVTLETYANMCTLEAKACHRGLNVTKVNDGECNTVGLISGTLHGIIGGVGRRDIGSSSDTNSDANVNLNERKCDIICPQDWSPICGSDGKTYGNYCALRVESCRQDGKVFLVQYGACDEDIDTF